MTGESPYRAGTRRTARRWVVRPTRDGPPRGRGGAGRPTPPPAADRSPLPPGDHRLGWSRTSGVRGEPVGGARQEFNERASTASGRGMGYRVLGDGDPLRAGAEDRGQLPGPARHGGERSAE